jgi:hypothetical protein
MLAVVKHAIGGNTPAPSGYAGGKFLATTGNGIPVEIELHNDARSYFYCNQDMINIHPFKFPAVPSNQPPGYEWMTEEQDFAYVYGYTCLGIIVFISLTILNKISIRVMEFFFSPFEVSLRLTLKKIDESVLACKNISAVYLLQVLCTTLLNQWSSPYPPTDNTNDSIITRRDYPWPLLAGFPISAPIYPKPDYPAILFQFYFVMSGTLTLNSLRGLTLNIHRTSTIMLFLTFLP